MWYIIFTEVITTEPSIWLTTTYSVPAFSTIFLGGKLSQVAKTPNFFTIRHTFAISPNCSFHSPIPTFSCTLKDSMQARSINKLNYQKWIDFSWAIHSLTRKYQAILKENLNGASKVIRAVRYKWSKTNAVRDARKFMSRCLECNIPVRNCPSMR